MDKYEKIRQFIETGNVDHLAKSVASIAKTLKDHKEQIDNARRLGLGPNLLAESLLPFIYSEIRQLQSQVDKIETRGRELMLEADKYVE